jgi:hypothetical protein
MENSGRILAYRLLALFATYFGACHPTREAIFVASTLCFIAGQRESVKNALCVYKF